MLSKWTPSLRFEVENSRFPASGSFKPMPYSNKGWSVHEYLCAFNSYNSFVQWHPFGAFFPPPNDNQFCHLSCAYYNPCLKCAEWCWAHSFILTDSRHPASLMKKVDLPIGWTKTYLSSLVFREVNKSKISWTSSVGFHWGFTFWFCTGLCFSVLRCCK